MRRFLSFAALTVITAFAAGSVYDFNLTSIDGKPLSLASQKGKVVMIVNVASKCGLTPQYAALESLYRKYKDQGFVIVGIPANNFGGQEPGTNEEIATFCKRTYDVSFPMTSKVSVKGDDKAPLYEYLTSQTGGDIKWNFTKFLIGRDGKLLERFEPKVTPDSIEVVSAVERALK
jgi:glutathione peroxidase